MEAFLQCGISEVVSENALDFFATLKIFALTLFPIACDGGVHTHPKYSRPKRPCLKGARLLVTETARDSKLS